MVTYHLSFFLIFRLFLQRTAKGEELLDLVFRHLELIEREYFALQFTEMLHHHYGSSSFLNGSVSSSSPSSSSTSTTVYNVSNGYKSQAYCHTKLLKTFMFHLYSDGLIQVKKFASKYGSLQHPFCYTFGSNFTYQM